MDKVLPHFTTGIWLSWRSHYSREWSEQGDVEWGQSKEEWNGDRARSRGMGTEQGGVDSGVGVKDEESWNGDRARRSGMEIEEQTVEWESRMRSRGMGTEWE